MVVFTVALTAIDEASVAVSAARAATGTVTYDEPVDLGVYDGFMGVA